MLFRSCGMKLPSLSVNSVTVARGAYIFLFTGVVFFRILFLSLSLFLLSLSVSLSLFLSLSLSLSFSLFLSAFYLFTFSSPLPYPPFFPLLCFRSVPHLSLSFPLLLRLHPHLCYALRINQKPCSAWWKDHALMDQVLCGVAVTAGGGKRVGCCLKNDCGCSYVQLVTTIPVCESGVCSAFLFFSPSVSLSLDS